MLKAQVTKLHGRLSGSRICEDRDGQGESSKCMVDGKWQCMGGAMKQGSAKVKDDIVRGMEGFEDVVVDGACNRLTDKARSNS